MPEVCTFFLAGNCAYGSKCRYDHEGVSKEVLFKTTFDPRSCLEVSDFFSGRSAISRCANSFSLETVSMVPNVATITFVLPLPLHPQAPSSPPAPDSPPQGPEPASGVPQAKPRTKRMFVPPPPPPPQYVAPEPQLSTAPVEAPSSYRGAAAIGVSEPQVLENPPVIKDQQLTQVLSLESASMLLCPFAAAGR